VIASGSSAALFGYASITGNERQPLLRSPERVEDIVRAVAAPAGTRRLLVGYLSIVPGDRAEEEMAIAYGLGPEGLGFRKGEADGAGGSFPYELCSGSALPGPGEILLSESFAERLAAKAGRPLVVGSLITATALKDAGLGVKSLRISGLYRYDGGVSELDRIVILAESTASRLLLDEAELASGGAAGATKAAVDGARQGGAVQEPSDESLFSSVNLVAEGADGAPDIPSTAGAGAVLAGQGAVTVQKASPEHGNWHYLCVEPAPGTDVAATMRSLDAAFRETDIDARAFSWAEASSGYASGSAIFRAVALGAIGVAALFAILILANSLVILAASRTRTIGTIRALGADRGTVFRWICLEGLIAAGLGAIVGAAVAAGILSLVSAAALPVRSPALRELFASATFAAPVRGADIVAATALALAAASPACLAAAGRALRIEPATAMRA
jgi:hypothetical protein